MSPTDPIPAIFGGAAAAAAALTLTPFARAIARRVGLVAGAVETRWHRKPTPLLGGTAIFVATLAPVLLASRFSLSPVLWGWIGGGTLVFALGLLDDIVGLRPASKLIGQILAALVPLSLGLGISRLPPVASFGLTLLWLVGVTNAFNLIDNMDGLAAGIAAIAAVFLSLLSFGAGRPATALCALAVGGAAIGFLVYNFHPASIFMGDSGSLFLGFSLASLSLADAKSRPLASFSIIAAPLFVLLVPIFDTSLVTVLRILNRRPISQGGRDHSSHRLVSLGLSERSAVLTLYAIAIAAGLVAAAVPSYPATLSVVVMFGASLVVYYFGSYLGTVPIYASDEKSIEDARSRNLYILDTFVAYKRIFVDVSVDLLVVLASYLGAFLLRFEGVLSPLNQQLLVRSLGLLLALRLVSFFAFGLYRHVHGSFTMYDFLAILKAVVVSSAAFVTLLVLLFRFRDYSRAVIVIDMILTLSGITFARIAVRSFQELFGGLPRPGERRALIVGAGSLGDGVARLIKADGQRAYRIVGFLDDSPAKIGRNLAGHRVVGKTSEAEEVIRRLRVDEVILACSTLDPARKQEIRRICDELGLPSREAGIF